MKGSNNLLDGMSGSLGTLTAVVAKDGETILKGKITNMTNPQTAAQTAQRSAWTLTVIIARLLLVALRACYAKKSVLQSAFNSFTSDAVKAIKAGNASSLDACMPLIKVADGPTLLSPNDSASAAASLSPGANVTVNVDWTYDAASFPAAAEETACIIAVNPTTGYVKQTLSGGTNRDELSHPEILVVQSAGETHVYLFFLNPNTGDYSPSEYVGSVSINGTFTAV